MAKYIRSFPSDSVFDAGGPEVQSKGPGIPGGIA